MQNNNKEKPNQSINSNRRKLLGLAGVAGAGTLLSPLLAKAQPSTIIEAGSNVDTASYIIFKDGNTIYAKNGTTGKIDYSGTDASTVIQSIVDTLTATGGRIYFKAGVYRINSTLIIPSTGNIIMEGENRYTTQLLGSSTLTNMIIVGNEIKQVSSFILRDIRIDGGGSSICDILTIRNYRNFNISNASFYNFKIGIHLDVYGGDRFAYHGKIDTCGISGVYGGNPNYAGTGIKLTGVTDHTANTNMITNTSCGLNNIGIHIDKGSSNLIEKCELSYNNTGLLIDSESNGNNVLFGGHEGNKITNIQINNGAQGNRILYPSMAPPVSGGERVINSGYGTVFEDIGGGYRTKNSGRSLGTGAQQAIQHRLAKIPNRIMLSNEDDGANPYQSSPADDQNIYVTAAENRKYQWMVEYKNTEL